jgi:hypothetical protein
MAGEVGGRDLPIFDCDVVAGGPRGFPGRQLGPKFVRRRYLL